MTAQNDLIEARFIWTEPHSRRIIIELDLRKEIENGITVMVAFESTPHSQGKKRVTFMQHMIVCPECMRVLIEYSWEAVVQIRQHVCAAASPHV